MVSARLGAQRLIFQSARTAKALLLPVGARRQLFELSDDMATKLDVEFYLDARDALMKALAE